MRPNFTNIDWINGMIGTNQEEKPHSATIVNKHEKYEKNRKLLND